MATLTEVPWKSNSPVKCSILLAILNIFESGNGREMTGDVEAMHALGVRDVESLESYLEAKFHFEHFDEDSLKNLFDSLLVLFPNDDLLPAPVDAEIDYDNENTMSVGLSIYADVFDYRQADLTFRKYLVKLPETKTVGQVVNVLQSVSDEAFKISEHLTDGSEFKISLCQKVK
ncbi:MAG: hypothetical protein M1130_03715 [Actinobacteria bacterium]|nr:hypothetical protein [Actinomycetota bacterium]